MVNPLSPGLTLYKELLLKWSKAVNLVSPSTLPDCETRHFADSTQLLPLLPDGAKCLFDFGSGAGFPAMVLAIERPDLRVHLFESDQKKCSFLQTVSRETHIPVVIHTARIESVDESSVPKPDVMTARALASLVRLLELSEPWWTGNPDLVLLFPKGMKAEEEIAEAEKAFSFSCEIFPSRTEKDAKILRISRVSRLPVSSKKS